MISVLITSSILIAVIAALRPLLRGRSKPLVQYGLWLIAALRLLVPLELAPSAHSALALLNRAEQSAHLAQSIGQTALPLPAMSYEDAYGQALREYQQDAPLTTSFTGPAGVELRAKQLQAESPTLSQLAGKYARPVWLGGMAVMAAWFLLVNLRLRRKLRRALPVEADCPLPVRVSPELPSPCLCGLFRPTVYVTPAALADPDRLRHVLAHELTHYRHWDHLWALVRCLCLCVYWFDPLVWWAAAMSRQDCELACDAGAIRRLGEDERIPYGRTLVAMISAGRNPLLQTATTMTGGKRRVKERVELIARRPKTAVALVLAAALVLGLTVGFTFTGAPEEAPDPLSADTLQERLAEIPEELRDTVVNHPEETSVLGTDNVLASYWLDVPAEPEDKWLTHLLTVCQWNQEQIEKHFHPQGNGGYGAFDEVEVFAWDGESYYVFNYPSDFQREDTESFSATLYAVKEYAAMTLLATEGVEPYVPDPAQQAIQSVVDRLMASPSVSLSLAPAGTSRIYAYPTVPTQELDSYHLQNLPTAFHWEEAPYSTSVESDSLRIESGDGSASLLLSEGSFLVLATLDGETTCYKGHPYGGAESAGRTPFEALRRWFDAVELYRLRTTSVPDRGQSHQEIVEEWIQGYEGAYLNCAPGSQFACTYVRPADIQADAHSWMEKADLDEFAQSRDHAGDDYGKTWFTFSYSLVFVPVDQSETSGFWAGNTWYYEEDDAPEGALVYTHVGYMDLIDGEWVCQGVGTGW